MYSRVVKSVKTTYILPFKPVEKKNMKSLALITGATSGIGRATALKLAQNNFDLILTGRRTEKLNEISQTLQKEFSIKVTPLCFDLSKRQECEDIFKKFEMQLSQVTVLINNAGLARGSDPLQKASLDDFDEMIDTNVKGLLYMTSLCLPALIKNAPSHIINLGSVAGRWSYGGGSTYCASKFAVRAISESLRMDLLGKNVRVTNISPGMVETEFSEVRFKDKEKAKKVYEGFKPLTAEDVSETILWSLTRPQHVNIQELVIYPTAQASVSQVHRE